MRIFASLSLGSLGLILTACHGSPAQAPDRHRDELKLPPVGPTIAASFEGKTVDVELSSVAPESHSSSVALASVFQAAFPSVPTTGLHFDLVGSDGFRPMSRPRCPRLLSGDELAKAHLDPVTHNVSYDSDLKLPGCYRVRAVVRLEATR